MTISSSSGTSGLRLKVGAARRLLGTMSTCMTLAREKVVATATLHDAGPSVHEPSSQNMNFHSFPCMPYIHQHNHHRDKIATNDGGININKMFKHGSGKTSCQKRDDGK